MKKRISVLAAVVLAVGFALCLAACGETKDDTVTVTLWHVYGGEVNSPMTALVEEFNRTVGQEQGIRVRVDSVSNSGVIHESCWPPPTRTPERPSCRISSCPTPKPCWRCRMMIFWWTTVTISPPGS